MDTHRLRKLAGMSITESNTISHHDHAGDQGKITNIIDNATNALMDNDQEVTPENIMQWVKSRYQLSRAELGHVKDQLEKEADTSPTEQQEQAGKSETQLWNRVMKMISEADEKGIVEDIGQKRYSGVKYHEFMIDGHVFHVMLDEGER